jgi:hypothetical protein
VSEHTKLLVGFGLMFYAWIVTFLAFLIVWRKR